MNDDTTKTDAPDQVSAVPAAAPLAEAAPDKDAADKDGQDDGAQRLTDDVIAGIKTVYDPEIPADIYELGLIYKIEITDERAVNIEMTLTTPNCPSAQDLPIQVENAVSSVPGVGPVKVDVVWDPPWDPSRMSDEARLVLNMW